MGCLLTSITRIYPNCLQLLCNLPTRQPAYAVSGCDLGSEGAGASGVGMAAMAAKAAYITITPLLGDREFEAEYYNDSRPGSWVIHSARPRCQAMILCGLVVFAYEIAKSSRACPVIPAPFGYVDQYIYIITSGRHGKFSADANFICVTWGSDVTAASSFPSRYGLKSPSSLAVHVRSLGFY